MSQFFNEFAKNFFEQDVIFFLDFQEIAKNRLNFFNQLQ